jgi:hypothetical protein
MWAFGITWRPSFVVYLKKSANQKQELPVAAMFVNRPGHN